MMDAQAWAAIGVFVAGQAITLTWIVATTKADARSIRSELKELKDVAKAIGEVLKTVAVQGSRLDRCEADIRDMQQGEGLVFRDSPIARAFREKKPAKAGD